MSENGDKPTKQQELPAKPRAAEPKPIPIDGPCQGVLDRVAKESKNLQPTPRLGLMVGWINRLGRTEPRPGLPPELEYRPAIVEQRLSPGRVNLCVFDNGTTFPARGARFISHPTMLKEAGNAIGEGGAWFYTEVLYEKDFSIPAEDYDAHRKALEETRNRALADNQRRHNEALQRDALAAQYRAQQQAAQVQV